MANNKPNTEGLKPFKSGNDARRNTSGKNGSTVTKWTKEYLEMKTISYNIVTTNNHGEKRQIKGKITGRGKTGQINQLIAIQLLTKAVKGDLNAIREVLDRTEGKPKQALDIENFKNGFTVGYIDDTE